MEDKQEKKGLSRREFMKAAGVTAAGVAASSLLTNKVFAAAGAAPAPGRVIGANDRINIGMIGIGGMGSGHFRMIRDMQESDNVQIAAVCDVWSKRRNEFKDKAKLTDDKAYEDYRKLLENKDIDVVVIATADHWHGQIACDAMNAGKHVYVEKPMTRHLEEAFAMYDTAKRTGKLVQVGAQKTNDIKWRKTGELVKAGKIGTVVWAQGCYCRNTPTGEWNYYAIDKDCTPESLNWNMWLGKAPKRAFSAERYFRWRKYWDYGTGIIGDLWPHMLHPLMIATNKVDQWPTRAMCLGANIMDSDKGTAEKRDVADTTMMTVQFGDGSMIYMAGCSVNEQGVPNVIRGNKATLYFEGNKIQLRPERPYVDEIDQEDVVAEGPGESQSEQHRNLWNGIRKGEALNCDIELGTRVQTMICMAEKASRENKTVSFDPQKRKIIA